MVSPFYYQVMLNIRPYSRFSDLQVLLALARGEPPADTRGIQSPSVLPSLLNQCWQPLAASRPSIAQCKNELTDFLHAQGNLSATSPDNDLLWRITVSCFQTFFGAIIPELTISTCSLALNVIINLLSKNIPIEGEDDPWR